MSEPLVIWTLPLGSAAELRLSLDTFNGKARADLRTWADYQAGPVLTRGPTKKGVSIPLSSLGEAAAALADADRMARDLGLIRHGGGKAA
jgi:hypothetical protein